MNESTQSDVRFSLQESQYQFPYHYLPHLDESGVGRRMRIYDWGYEYLVYMYYTLEYVNRLNPASVLDVGCGDGRFSGMLSPAVKRVGVDLSAKAIAYARAFHEDVEFQCGSVDSLSEQFDVVAAIQVLEHVPDGEVAEFLQQLAARARTGGHVIIVVPTVNLPLHPKHYRHYSLDVFQDQLQRSGAPLKLVESKYLCGSNMVSTFFYRWNHNLWWLFEVGPVRRFFWRTFNDRLKLSSPEKSRNVLFCLLRE
jgi:SAM-dependent methyltransferase